MGNLDKLARTELMDRIRDYGDEVSLIDSKSNYIPVHNSLFNGDESVNLISSILGEDVDYRKSFNLKMMDYTGKGNIRISSSPSAYISLLKALSSDSLGSRAILPGDEVITTPNNVSLISALCLFGVIPVLVDVDLDTMLPDPISIEMLIVEGKTKAVMVSSVCGNTLNGEIIRDLADDFSITFVEDIGYGFGGRVQGVPVGSFADIVIYTFHSNLIGDTKVIISKSHLVHELIGQTTSDEESTLWVGKNNNKLVYSYLDAQMDKCDYYTSMRRVNWTRLYAGLMKYNKMFRFHNSHANSGPSWSVFVLTLKEPSPFSREDIISYLENHGVGATPLVGNIFLAPAYKRYLGEGDELINSDYISRNSFMVGCNPCMKLEHTDYIIKTIEEFMEEYVKKSQD